MATKGNGQRTSTTASQHTSGTYTEKDPQQKAADTAQEAKNVASEKVDEAKEKASEVVDQVKQKASETAQQVTDEAESQIDQRTTQAGDRLGSVAETLRHTGKELSDQDDQLLANYADIAADQVDQFSVYLQEHSANDFMRDLRDMAQRQPELTAAVALGIGFFVGRFLKSTSPTASQSQRPNGAYYTQQREMSYRLPSERAYRTPERRPY